MTTHSASPLWAQYLIPALIVGIVLFFRLRAVGKARKLRIERLWILPVVYTAIVGLVFWSAPPHGLFWLWSLIAFAIGAAAGWWRGKLMRIAVDPETHELSQTTSPAALLFIVALIALRSGSRAIATSMAGPGPAGIMAVTDILVAFALGFIVFQRIEVALRARRMLAAARGAPA